ncbi:hypothetical protein M407DRAFT_30738 [Tulasnella calospora MUT 4182]|uniref:Glycoside hydrolase family 79 protein n=1 Tax=Tulasnella calospora MUT 4182 TaxID=1051891 RepID=A0A0C3PX33_9AGAM|nr:hypothetical protein M407DRAFT_30738 [Tulasnella calospora MUT 4182]
MTVADPLSSIPTQFWSPDGQYTGLAAFDPVQSTVPAPPQATQAPVTISLPTGNVPGLNAKQHRTDFMGISLEMSVSDRISESYLPVQITIAWVAIRVGSNSQEQATMIPACAPLEGPTINKTANPVQVPGFTSSPLLTISEDLIYAMNNISALQEIPTIIDDVTSILGTNRLGFQMANEPDIYESYGKKPASYQIPEYMADWERVRSTYAADRTDLIAPNFAPHLHSVSIQHYKDNACANALIPMPPQDAFLTYQTHSSAQNFWNPYVNASQIINAAGKDFINQYRLLQWFCRCFGLLRFRPLPNRPRPPSASIGMSQILLHNGGDGQAYNLFTPPPNNQSTLRQWTTTPPYYSALIMSEVTEEEGSQVMDLLLGGNSTHTPGYAIYKSGTPIKLALFNYITDPSGANDAQFNFPSTQPSVRVKYFSSATGSHTSSILLGELTRIYRSYEKKNLTNGMGSSATQ